jgi:PAS domain S-box-containing protein
MSAPRDVPFQSAELGALARILESITATLDFDEVMQRVVDRTREEFEADRAWILGPIDEPAEHAEVAYESTTGEWPGAKARGEPIPLGPSRPFIRRVMEGNGPVEGWPGTPGLDADMLRQYGALSQLVQVLRTRDGKAWAFGLHSCSHARSWSDEEKRLFATIGRYATLAIDNAILHRRAIAQSATLEAILDQIPEAAAIYAADGSLLRMNVIAQAQRPQLFGGGADERLRANRHRGVDGTPLRREDLPSMRALRGEQVSGDFSILEPATDEERVISYRGAPIRDASGAIVGSIVLSRDVTEERAAAEQERWRRKRAETLGMISIDSAALQSDFGNLDELARQIGEGMQVNVRIYLYRAATDALELAGSHARSPEVDAMLDLNRQNPVRPGEGLAGTIFQIGQPLLFADVKAGSLAGYARSEEERVRIENAAEQSVLGFPIEAYGERIGTLILGHLDPRRSFHAEDMAFARSVAQRLAAAHHIHKLNRLATEGHRAAEDLARREVDARARLEAVLETAPIGIAVVSADELRFELANREWIEFAARYGRVGEGTELIGLRVGDIIPHLEPILSDAAEKNRILVDQEIPIRSGGHVFFFDRIISPVRGRFSGIPQSLTILVKDVTESVRAKQEIEALVRMMEDRTARLDSILGSMTDALWVFDDDGEVVDVNRAALSMFGLASQSDAIARGSFVDFRLRYPDNRPIPAEDLPFARALRGEIVPDFVAVGAHLITGRDIDLSVAAAPIRSGGAVVGAIMVVRDISGLQELDRKKDEFLSVASHELRTPLTTIRGYTQLLLQLIYEIDPEERTTYLQSMLGEIDRMMGLITELLDVSRIQRNRLQVSPRVLDWVEFVRTLVASASLQHPERALEFSSSVESIQVKADPQRMRQVIDNLMSNALKYSPELSPVRVRVETDGTMVSTLVSDEGIGIPADELPRLFERFHRARNVSSHYYGGLGLGLYISRAIIEAHGGTISVDTSEGKGSTFRVDLPLGDAGSE